MSQLKYSAQCEFNLFAAMIGFYFLMCLQKPRLWVIFRVVKKRNHSGVRGEEPRSDSMKIVSQSVSRHYQGLLSNSLYR